MRDKTYRVRFRHPLDGEALEIELSAVMTFGEILKMLYSRGYIKPKTADYAFIIGGHLCALNKTLSDYVLPEFAGIVNVEVNGLLSIMS
jgi:hypothetical protein